MLFECTLDFLSVEGGSYINAPDGSLVAEFQQIEKLHRASILEGSYSPYACAVSNSDFFECLDFASASTLSASDDMWTTQASDVFYGTLSSTLSSQAVATFGQNCSGNAKGDGALNSFDIAIVVMAMFEQAPYNIPLTTSTTQARGNTRSRCGDTSRSVWHLLISVDYCDAGGGYRRLEEVPSHSDEDMTFSQWIVTDTGVWYKMEFADIITVVEIMLGNVTCDGGVYLSNLGYPRNDSNLVNYSPSNPLTHEVRWARKMEYLGQDTNRCAYIVGGLAGSQALFHDTLSVRQHGGDYCAFDIYMYVPNKQSPHIMRGTTGTTTKAPFTLYNDIYLPQYSPSPHPPSPHHPPSPISSPADTDACMTCNIYYDFDEGNKSITFEHSVSTMMQVVDTYWHQYLSVPVASKRWCGCSCSDPTFRPSWLAPIDVCAFARSGLVELNATLENSDARETFDRLCTDSPSSAAEDHIRMCISPTALEWLFLNSTRNYCKSDVFEDTQIEPHLGYDGNVYCGEVANTSRPSTHSRGDKGCPFYYNESYFNDHSPTIGSSLEAFIRLISDENHSWPIDETRVTEDLECTCEDPDYRPVWIAPIDLCFYVQTETERGVPLDEVIPVYAKDAYDRSCTNLSPDQQNADELHMKLCVSRPFIQYLFYNTSHCEIDNGVPNLAPDGTLMCSTVIKIPADDEEDESPLLLWVWIILFTAFGMVGMCCFAYAMMILYDEDDKREKQSKGTSSRLELNPLMGNKPATQSRRSALSANKIASRDLPALTFRL